MTKEKPKKSKRHPIIWAICFAVPVFIATLYIMYAMTTAHLFSTPAYSIYHPIYFEMYILPWVVAIISALPFALIGLALGKRFSKKRVSKIKIINIVIIIIFIILTAIGSILYSQQRETNLSQKDEIKDLKNKIKKSEKIILPQYVSAYNVSKIIRSEKKGSIIYAMSRRPMSSMFYTERYQKSYKNSEEEFANKIRGVIKSTDNGKNWNAVYIIENDILDLAVSEKNLYAMTVSRQGGGSEEIYIKIATSQDEGNNWSESKEIAKNDTDDESQSQPFTINSISNIMVDPNNTNKSYILYKENFASESYDKMIYTEDFWNTWQRKDL